MPISSRVRQLSFLLSCLFLLVVASSCDDSLTFQTPGPINITFAIDAQGNISIQGGVSLVTPIGTFTVGGGQTFSTQQSGTILLVIIHIKGGKKVEDVYQLKLNGEKATVTTQGTTTIQYLDQNLLIDASKGNIQKIDIQLILPTPVPPTEVQPVLDYCNALQTGQYAQFFTNDSGPGLTIGESQTVSSANAFGSLATGVDQKQGKVATCAVKNDIRTSDGCMGVSDPGEDTLVCTATYTITVHIVRSHGSSYSVSVDVTDQAPGGTAITGISKL